MIFVTGDIHGDPTRFSVSAAPYLRGTTKDDYVIICGDFGLVWGQEETSNEKYWLDWLEDKPFTVLFVDGNHENFDRLNSYPVEEWCGGKVHKVRPHVIHLMRGQVFNLQGKTFFTMGGASSHDIEDGVLQLNETEKIKAWSKKGKFFRVEHLSWWKEELPNQQEIQESEENLNKCGRTVDFIISHCPPASLLHLFNTRGPLKIDSLEEYFQELTQNVDYKHWYYGHMHQSIHDGFTKSDCLYYEILQIA